MNRCDYTCVRLDHLSYNQHTENEIIRVEPLKKAFRICSVNREPASLLFRPASTYAGTGDET